MLLTQADFAELVGVTQPMVSKWKKAGHLALGEKGRIEAGPSLDSLAGILDDALHAVALQKLATFAPKNTAPAPQPQTLNSRQEKDHWHAQIMAMKYAREAGQVCDVIAVEAHAAAAVEEFKLAIAQTTQDAAKSIARNFGIHADKIPVLRRTLSIEMVERAQQNFADRMANLAARAMADTMGRAALPDITPDFTDQQTA